METKMEKTRWHQTFSAKMVLLCVITLLLLIPLAMVTDIIRDRIGFANQAKREISKMWSGEQIVSGPVFNVPISREYVTNNGVQIESKIIHILPDVLSIKGNVKPEVRYKSIYKTVVYGSSISLKGHLSLPEFTNYNTYDIHWDKAYITFGISDNRGVKGDVEFDINGKHLKAIPGLKDYDLFKSGISFDYPIDSAIKKMEFNTSVEIDGSDKLIFLPIGKRTTINVSSDWSDPSFIGDFLPAEREISENGFNANWTITELNRSYPQIWDDKSQTISKQTVGVEFLLMADHYQKSLRSAKYGILFIVLTFIVLIFSELIYKSKILIFHYVLVGFALILFFSLLTALSEHIGFNAAYLFSMISIISLIAFFTRGLLNSNKIAIIFNAVLLLFYIFIFVLLSLKDYAYLAGNIGLFVILSIVMMVSKKIKFSEKP